MGLLTRLMLPGLAAITVILVMIPCSADAHCTATWKHFQGHCYKFFPQSITLEANINYCRKLMAGVLEIRSATENDFITSYLKSLGDKTNFVWLGIRDGKYLSDGQKITFTNWARRQPDKKDQRCIVIATDGAWYRAWCQGKRRYIICRKQIN